MARIDALVFGGSLAAAAPMVDYLARGRDPDQARAVSETSCAGMRFTGHLTRSHATTVPALRHRCAFPCLVDSREVKKVGSGLGNGYPIYPAWPEKAFHPLWLSVDLFSRANVASLELCSNSLDTGILPEDWELLFRLGESPQDVPLDQGVSALGASWQELKTERGSKDQLVW